MARSLIKVERFIGLSFRGKWLNLQSFYSCGDYSSFLDFLGFFSALRAGPKISASAAPESTFLYLAIVSFCCFSSNFLTDNSTFLYFSSKWTIIASNASPTANLFVLWSAFSTAISAFLIITGKRFSPTFTLM